MVKANEPGMAANVYLVQMLRDGHERVSVPPP